MKMLLNKKKGYILIEIMIALSLGAGILLTIYNSYNSIIKSINFLKNKNDMNTEKLIFNFNAKRDIYELFFPLEIEKISNISKKNKKDNNNNKNQNLNNSENKNEEKNKENDSFEKYSKYFPKLKNKDNQIFLSFYSTRSIFSKNKFSKITYTFNQTKETYKDYDGKTSSLYSLTRKEEEVSVNEKNKKNNKEYELIEYVQNPKIYFLSPIIPKNENENKEKEDNNSNNLKSEKKENNKEEKEKSLFQKWYEKKEEKYEILNDQENFTAEEFLKKSYLPSLIIFEGTIISENKTKKTPLDLIFCVPSGESFLSNIFYEKEDKKENPKNKNLPATKDNKNNPPSITAQDQPKIENLNNKNKPEEKTTTISIASLQS